VAAESLSLAARRASATVVSSASVRLAALAFFAR